MRQDPHVFMPNFVKGLLIAGGLMIVLMSLWTWGQVPLDEAPLEQAKASIESFVNRERFSDALRGTDTLLSRSEALLAAGKVREAKQGFAIVRDLAILGREELHRLRASKNDDGKPTPAPSPGAAGFSSREANARFGLAACMMTDLRALHSEELETARLAGREYSPPISEIEPIRNEIQAGLKLAPEHERLWRLQGILEQMVGRFPLAATALERAVEINPRFAAAYNNLGQVYVKLRQPDKAVDAFEKALLASDEGSAAQRDALYNLGLFHADSAAGIGRTNDPTERQQADQLRRKALRHLQAFLDAADPNDPDRATAEARIREMQPTGNTTQP